VSVTIQRFDFWIIGMVSVSRSSRIIVRAR